MQKTGFGGFPHQTCALQLWRSVDGGHWETAPSRMGSRGSSKELKLHKRESTNKETKKDSIAFKALQAMIRKTIKWIFRKMLKAMTVFYVLINGGGHSLKATSSCSLNSLYTINIRELKQVSTDLWLVCKRSQLGLKHTNVLKIDSVFAESTATTDPTLGV